VFLIDSLLLTTSTNVNIYWNPKEKFSQQQQQHFDALEAQLFTFMFRTS
jgi:hypothetical protein